MHVQSICFRLIQLRGALLSGIKRSYLYVRRSGEHCTCEPHLLVTCKGYKRVAADLLQYSANKAVEKFGETQTNKQYYIAMQDFDCEALVQYTDGIMF